MTVCSCPAETDFIAAARRGLLAIQKIAGKFAAAAQAQLAAGSVTPDEIGIAYLLGNARFNAYICLLYTSPSPRD